jgi:protein gp37
MKMAARIEKMHPGTHYAGTTKPSKAGPVWTGKLALAPDHILTQPLRWKKPRTIFVNSMGDLFHEDVSDEWINRVFAIMALAPQHTFQVLTKRSARMRTYVSGFECDGARPSNVAGAAGRLMEDGDNAHDYVANAPWPLPNVWLGVSAERQQEAEERIPDLLATPAAMRFVSAEPLLGPIDFEMLCTGWHFVDALKGLKYHDAPEPYVGASEACPRLDWIIVGGESGSRARPMHPDWPRYIRDQCARTGVPFFFKQWGEFGPAFGVDLLPTGLPWSGENQRAVARGVATAEQATRWMGKRRAGRFLDGVEHNAMPVPKEIRFG